MSKTHNTWGKKALAVLLTICVICEIMPANTQPVLAAEVYAQNEVEAWQDYLTMYTALKRGENPYDDKYFDHDMQEVIPLPPEEWAGIAWVDVGGAYHIQAIELEYLRYDGEDESGPFPFETLNGYYMTMYFSSAFATGSSGEFVNNILPHLKTLDLKGTNLMACPFPWDIYETNGEGQYTWLFELKNALPNLTKLDLSDNRLTYSSLPNPVDTAKLWPGIDYRYGGQISNRSLGRPELLTDTGVIMTDLRFGPGYDQEKINLTVVGVGADLPLGSWARFGQGGTENGDGVSFFPEASEMTAKITFDHEDFPGLVYEYTVTVPDMYTHVYRVHTPAQIYADDYHIENGKTVFEVTRTEYATVDYNALPIRVDTHPGAAVHPYPQTGAEPEEMPEIIDISTKDFEFTVSYGGTTRHYILRRYDAESACDFESFALNGYIGVIDKGAGVVDITVPAGTNLQNPAVVYDVPDGAQVSAPSSADFSQAVTYTITAINGETKTYTVYVAVEGSPCMCSIADISFAEPVAFALEEIETGSYTRTWHEMGLAISYYKEHALMNNLSVNNDILRHMTVTDEGFCKTPGHRTNGYETIITINEEEPNTAGAFALRGEVYNTRNVLRSMLIGEYALERVIQFNQPGVFTANVTVIRNEAALKTAPVTVEITDSNNFRFVGEDAEVDGKLSLDYEGGEVLATWQDDNAGQEGVFYKVFMRTYQAALGEERVWFGYRVLPHSRFCPLVRNSEGWGWDESFDVRDNDERDIDKRDGIISVLVPHASFGVESHVTIQRFVGPYVGTFEQKGTDYTKHINIPLSVDNPMPVFGVSLENRFVRAIGNPEWPRPGLNQINFSITRAPGLDKYSLAATIDVDYKFGADGNAVSLGGHKSIPVPGGNFSFDPETGVGTVILPEALLEHLAFKQNERADATLYIELLNPGGITISTYANPVTITAPNDAEQFGRLADWRGNTLGMHRDGNGQALNSGGAINLGPGHYDDAYLSSLSPDSLADPTKNPYVYAISLYDADSAANAEIYPPHRQAQRLIQDYYDYEIADPSICEIIMTDGYGLQDSIIVRALNDGDTAITLRGLNGDTIVIPVSVKMNAGKAALFYLSDAKHDSVRFGSLMARGSTQISPDERFIKQYTDGGSPFAGKEVRYKNMLGQEKATTVSAGGAIYIYDQAGLDTEYLDGSYVDLVDEKHYHLAFDNFYTGAHEAWMAVDPAVQGVRSATGEDLLISASSGAAARVPDSAQFYVIDGQLMNFAVIPYFIVDWSERGIPESGTQDSINQYDRFAYAVPIRKTNETIDKDGNIVGDFHGGEFAAQNMTMTLVSPKEESDSVPLNTSLYHRDADITGQTVYRQFNKGRSIEDMFPGADIDAFRRNTYIPENLGDTAKYPFRDYDPRDNKIFYDYFYANDGFYTTTHRDSLIGNITGYTYTPDPIGEPLMIADWLRKNAKISPINGIGVDALPNFMDGGQTMWRDSANYGPWTKHFSELSWYFAYQYSSGFLRDLTNEFVTWQGEEHRKVLGRYDINRSMYDLSNQGYILDQTLSEGRVRPIDYMDGDVIVETADQRLEGTEGWYSPAGAVFTLREYMYQRYLGDTAFASAPGRAERNYPYHISDQTLSVTPTNSHSTVIRTVVKDKNDTVMDISLDRWGVEVSDDSEKKLMLYLNCPHGEEITGFDAYLNNPALPQHGQLIASRELKDVTETQMMSKWYLATTNLTSDLVNINDTFMVDFIVRFADGKSVDYSSTIMFRSFKGLTIADVEAQVTPDNLPFTGTISSGSFNTNTAKGVSGFNFPLPKDFSVRVKYDFSEGFNRGTFRMLVGRESDLAASDGESFSDRAQKAGVALHNMVGNRSAYGSKTGKISAKFDIAGYVEGIVRFTGDGFSLITTGGGIMVGINTGYSYTVNTMVAFIPVYYGIEVGAGLCAEVAFIRTDLENDEDFSLAYRTIVTASGFVKVSGGIGFDMGIFAAKIGPYGMLSASYSIGFVRNKGQSYFGQQVTVRGEIGIEAKVKFILYEKRYVLCDAGFTWTTRSGDGWIFDGRFEPPRGRAAAEPMVGMVAGTMQGLAVDTTVEMLAGMRVLPAEAYNPDGAATGEYVWLDLGTQLESREYLQTERTWAGRQGIQPLSAVDVTDGIPTKLVDNTYPYAYPHLSNEGNMLVMLDDSLSADYNKMTPIYSLNSCSPNKIDSDENTPSSNVHFDGTGSFGVAAWENLSVAWDGNMDSDPADYLSKTEIKAAVWNGTAWSVTRLTENGVPDMGPKVSVNGDSAAVVWARVDKREVGEDISAENKSLYVRRYNGGNWGVDGGDEETDERPTYAEINLDIPSTANVQSYDIALGKGGGILVAYTFLTTGGVNETAAVYVSPDDAVSTPVSVTGGGASNGAARVSVMNIGGNEQFVAAWYSKAIFDMADAGTLAAMSEEEYLEYMDGLAAINLRGDIMLQAFDMNGAKTDALPSSLGLNRQDDDPEFSEVFEFVRGEGAIAWVNPYDEETAGADEYGIFAKYVVTANGEAELSAAYKIAKGSIYNVIDAFSVARKHNGRLFTAFLATEYNPVEVESDHPDDFVSLVKQANLFTSDAEIVNIAEIASLDYSNRAVAGQESYITVNLRNAGTVGIKSVLLYADDTAQAIVAATIAPNQVASFAVTVLQGEVLKNIPIYAVVTFEDNSIFTTKIATARFALPDISIDKVTLADEAAIGTGVVTVEMSNRGNRDLSGLTVSLGVFEDIERTQSAVVSAVVSGNGSAYGGAYGSGSGSGSASGSGSVSGNASGSVSGSVSGNASAVVSGNGSAYGGAYGSGRGSEFDDIKFVDDDGNPKDTVMLTFTYDLRGADYDDFGLKMLYLEASVADANGVQAEETAYDNNTGVAVFTDPQPLIDRQFSIELAHQNGNITATARNGLNEGMMVRLLITTYDAGGNVLEQKLTGAQYIDSNGQATFAPVEFTPNYARAAAMLNVQNIPIVTIEGISGEPEPEAEITLVATATPSAVLSYQWYQSEYWFATVAGEFGGEKIEGATDANYMIPADGDGMYYFCAVSAEAGTSAVSGSVLAKINAGPPEIIRIPLQGGKIGEEYSQTLTAVGSRPIVWAIDGSGGDVGGSDGDGGDGSDGDGGGSGDDGDSGGGGGDSDSGGLPDGLTLNPDTGEISGTPVREGTFVFTVKATNIEGSDTKEFTIVIIDSDPETPTYTISASTLTGFGNLQTPYTQPAAQVVTISNTGTGPVTLTQPTSTKYDIGTLSTTTLATNGATATITVRPKASLAVGNHDEIITISGSNGASATVNATFSVTASGNTDNADITAAKQLLEAYAFGTVMQSDINTQAEAKARIEGIIDIELSVSGTGVIATIVDVAFTAAVAGTAGTPVGTHGSYIFTVRLNKGAGAEQTTMPLTLVITATAYSHASGGSPVFTDGDGVILTNMTAATFVTTLLWQNSTSNIEMLTMYVAVYNPKGGLAYVDYTSKEIAVGQESEFTVILNLHDNLDGRFAIEGYTTKVFLWETNTFEPICEAFSFPNASI